MIRVIVAGPRGFTEYDYVARCIEQTLRDRPKGDVQIVSGMARGVDTLAVDWARENGYDWKEFPVTSEDWRRYPALVAGHIRNQAMADYATHLIAIWDGHSRGTRSMIDKARRAGLMVKIYFYTTGQVHYYDGTTRIFPQKRQETPEISSQGDFDEERYDDEGELPY